MKWSWKIFTAFGIDVYIHVTFLLIVPYAMLGRPNLREGFTALLLMLAIFGCVLLHEFGHALTAKRFGVRTRDIILLPIGGLARLERIPSEPRQELLIAVAGPAVNIALAAVFGLGVLTLGWGAPTAFGHGFLGSLLWINVGLAVFNFIPAFPMDGGRVLRALLAIRLDYLQATRIAVGVGQALAFGMGIFGFLNPNYSMLLLIAFFVYLGAAQEGVMVQYRYSFRGLPASVAMMTNFKSLNEDDRLEKAVEYLIVGSQVDFPVLRDHQVLGMLTRSALIDSLGKQGPQAAIRGVPIKPVKVVEDDMPLDRAYDELQAQAVQCLPVMRRGELVGLITMENLAEFAMVTSAIRGLRKAGAPAA